MDPEDTTTATTATTGAAPGALGPESFREALHRALVTVPWHGDFWGARRREDGAMGTLLPTPTHRTAVQHVVLSVLYEQGVIPGLLAGLATSTDDDSDDGGGGVPDEDEQRMDWTNAVVDELLQYFSRVAARKELLQLTPVVRELCEATQRRATPPTLWELVARLPVDLGWASIRERVKKMLPQEQTMTSSSDEKQAEHEEQENEQEQEAAATAATAASPDPWRFVLNPYSSIAAVSFLSCCDDQPEAWLTGWGEGDSGCSCHALPELMTAVTARTVDLIGGAWSGDDEAKTMIRELTQGLGLSDAVATLVLEDVRVIVAAFDDLRWFIEAQLDIVLTQARTRVNDRPPLMSGPICGSTLREIEFDVPAIQTAVNGEVLVHVQYPSETSDGAYPVVAVKGIKTSASSDVDLFNVSNAVTPLFSSIRPMVEAAFAHVFDECEEVLDVTADSQEPYHDCASTTTTGNNPRSWKSKCGGFQIIVRPLGGTVFSDGGSLMSEQTTQRTTPSPAVRAICVPNDAAGPVRVVLKETFRDVTIFFQSKPVPLPAWKFRDVQFTVPPGYCMVFPSAGRHQVDVHSPEVNVLEMELYVDGAIFRDAWISSAGVETDKEEMDVISSATVELGRLVITPWHVERQSLEDQRWCHYEQHLFPFGEPDRKPTLSDTRNPSRMLNVFNVTISGDGKHKDIGTSIHQLVWARLENGEAAFEGLDDPPGFTQSLLDSCVANRVAAKLTESITVISSTATAWLESSQNGVALNRSVWEIFVSALPLYSFFTECKKEESHISSEATSLSDSSPMNPVHDFEPYSTTQVSEGVVVGCGQSILFKKSFENISNEELHFQFRATGGMDDQLRRIDPCFALCWLLVHSILSDFRDFDDEANLADTVNSICDRLRQKGEDVLTQALLNTKSIEDISTLVTLVSEMFDVHSCSDKWVHCLTIVLTKVSEDWKVWQDGALDRVAHALRFCPHPLNPERPITMGPVLEMAVCDDVVPANVLKRITVNLQPFRTVSHSRGETIKLIDGRESPEHWNLLHTFSIPYNHKSVYARFDQTLGRPGDSRQHYLHPMPSDVQIDIGGRARFCSYLIGIHPNWHITLYRSFEAVITALVPLFERVCDSLEHDRPTFDLASCQVQSSHQGPKFSLRGRMIQVVIMVEEVDIDASTDSKPCEDRLPTMFKTLSPLAKGICIVDSDNLLDPQWNVKATSRDHAYMEQGSFRIKSNRCGALPCYYEDFRPSFKVHDPSRPGRLTVLTVYLLDPKRPFPSTMVCAPKRRDWVLETVVPLVGDAFGLPEDVQKLLRQMIDADWMVDP